VGRETRRILSGLSIKFLGDVQNYSEALLVGRLGKFGRRLFSLAAGIDASRVTTHTPVKSVSSEKTLARDVGDKRLLAEYLRDQAEEVGRQLRRKNLRARTVTLKMKDSGFRQVTRSTTLKTPTQSSETIYRSAAGLLDAHRLDKSLRLIGVGASGLVSGQAPVQQALFDGPEHKNAAWEKIDRTLDAISRKYGSGSIRKGR
jgi:DNA polymerase-4